MKGVIKFYRVNGKKLAVGQFPLHCLLGKSRVGKVLLSQEK